MCNIITVQLKTQLKFFFLSIIQFKFFFLYSCRITLSHWVNTLANSIKYSYIILFGFNYFWYYKYVSNILFDSAWAYDVLLIQSIFLATYIFHLQISCRKVLFYNLKWIQAMKQNNKTEIDKGTGQNIKVGFNYYHHN